MGRPRVLVVLFALVSGLFWTTGAVGANGAPAAEDAFVARVAAERSSSGLASYSVAGDLVAVARRHAARMAAEGRLYHNPALGSEVSGWTAVGENVGVGPSVDDVHRAFMASDVHRHAILSAEYTEVGIGVEVGGDGALWVVEVFRAPASAAPPQEDRGAGVPAASARTGARPVAPRVAAPAAPRPAVAAPVPVAVAATVTAPPVDPDAPLVASAVADGFAATGFVRPPALPAVVLGRSLTVAPSAAPRHVTGPIGVAASLLLLVVLALAVEVLGRVRADGYPAAVSVWRRQRNQASISSSRSPSSTAWTLPVS